MEEALTQHLLAQAGLTALVGNRITWARRQQGVASPSIVLHVIDRLPQYTMDGEANVTVQRIQTDCWAKDAPGPPPTNGYDTAKSTARQVKAALSGLRTTVGDVEFLGSRKEGEDDSFQQGAGGEALYGVRMDFVIWTRTAA